MCMRDLGFLCVRVAVCTHTHMQAAHTTDSSQHDVQAINSSDTHTGRLVRLQGGGHGPPGPASASDARHGSGLFPRFRPAGCESGSRDPSSGLTDEPSRVAHRCQGQLLRSCPWCFYHCHQLCSYWCNDGRNVSFMSVFNDINPVNAILHTL